MNSNRINISQPRYPQFVYVDFLTTRAAAMQKFPASGAENGWSKKPATAFFFDLETLHFSLTRFWKSYQMQFVAILQNQVSRAYQVYKWKTAHERHWWKISNRSCSQKLFLKKKKSGLFCNFWLFWFIRLQAKKQYWEISVVVSFLVKQKS